MIDFLDEEEWVVVPASRAGLGEASPVATL